MIEYSWSVYDKNDVPVFIAGTSQQCAKAMGFDDVETFYQTYYKCMHGINNKWKIYKDIKEDDIDDPA